MVNIIQEANKILEEEESKRLLEKYVKIKRKLISLQGELHKKEEALRDFNELADDAVKDSNVEALDELLSGLNMF